MEKIHTELVALADYAMTGEDKKLSVIGIFDKLFVRSLPTNHAKMAFVVTFIGEPSTTLQATIRIVAPSGKEEFSAPVSLTFGENGKFNFISNFEGFPFGETGEYQFVFLDGKKEIVSYTLDVIMVKDDEKRVAN